MAKPLSEFRIARPGRIRVEDFDPSSEPASSGSQEGDEERLSRRASEIGELQNRLYAEGRTKLLVVLQGMDTSGKDGAMRTVFDRTHPLGVQAHAFKVPTRDEDAHDYLWRVHARVPAAGEIGIFNRSHYEDLVVPRVRGTVGNGEWKRRAEQVVNFEKLLNDTGTHVVKIFLHLSKKVQKERLEARLTNPAKHWKFDPDDLVERARWSENLSAWSEAIGYTAVEHAPWWIVPSDSRLHRNLMVAEIVHAALKSINPQYPPLPPEFARLKVE